MLLQPVTTFGKLFRSNQVEEIIPNVQFLSSVQDLMMLSSHLNPVDRHGLKVLVPN